MHPEVLDERNKEIFFRLKRFGDFYLAGGTALALQIGHRISVDFDLFSGEEIPSALLQKTKKVFIDKNVVPSVNNSGELTVFVGDSKVTFLCYPFPVMFDLINYEGIQLLSIKEIAATKAYTIGRRGSLKDYVDVYFIISEGHCSLSKIIENAEKKYGSEFNARLFLEQLIYLEDLEDESIVFLKEKIAKDSLTEFFTKGVRKTFNEKDE